MMTRRSSPILLCLLLQFFTGSIAETTGTTGASNSNGASAAGNGASSGFGASTGLAAGNNGVHISGETIVDGLAGPNGAVVVRFLDTDFQGLTMEVETDMDQNMTMWFTNGTSIPIYVPFQKISGAIDCINQQLEEDTVIVSGTIRGTANEPIVDSRFFQEGDRFMTAVRSGGGGQDAKDQVGEISNMGQQENPDLSDCLYFVGSDFELRDVVQGHVTVY